MQSSRQARRLIEPSEAAALRRGWYHLTLAAAAMMVFTGVFACACDAPMIWDGSYQFCFSLIRQRPYFYLTRFHSYVLWLPMVQLSHFTDNLTVLKFAYGLPFTLAPAFSVLASWFVVKDRAPHLILWSIFGAAAGPLPGQIFIINDSIFQQHVFWPVFMGMLVPLDRPRVLLLAVLTPFQFSHQIGTVLLGGAAGAALLMAARDGRHRRAALVKGIVFAVLAGVAVWKALHFRDSWAEQEMTPQRIRESWQYGVEGPPLRGVILMWAAGVCALLYSMLRGVRVERVRRGLKWTAILCVLVSAVMWAVWGADAHKWTDAANYRRWVVPLTMPFYVLAFVDRWRSVRVDSIDSVRATALARAVGISVAATFMVVLSIQSIVFARLAHRLMIDVESCPTTLVPWERIGWSRNTAVSHWGSTSLVFVREGRVPHKLLLDKGEAEARKQREMLIRVPPRVPLAWFTPVAPTPGPGGWFDFRPLVYGAHHEPEPQ
jgi:hypothetical protein